METKRKSLFALDLFVHSLTSYEDYTFAELMGQEFIEKEMAALTNRFRNLSREEKTLKLAENKLPALDDAQNVTDEQEVTSKLNFHDIDLIILDEDNILPEENHPEHIELDAEEAEENEDDDADDDDEHPTADDDRRDDDDDNQGGADAQVLNKQANTTAADEPAEN